MAVWACALAAVFFGDRTENRTLAITNVCRLFLLNLGSKLKSPELFTEPAEVLKFLRAGEDRVSLNSLRIFKPGSE
jgi:hypothetical protein